MPTVEKVTSGRVYVRQVDREFSVGESVDVSDADAAYLVDERGDFEVVDDGDDSESDGTAEGDPIEGKPVAEIDVAEHLNRWLDQHYTHRAEQVRGGDVDDSLDAVAEAETSETVIEAVEERRVELED